MLNLILDKRDYIAGEIIDEICVDNWLDYITIGEKQNWVYDDSSACASFATENAIACKLNYYLKNNLIPEETVKWCKDNDYLVNDEFNFSDRYIAKLSQTTKEGNSANNVLNTIIGTKTKPAFGLIPESKWTFAMDDRNNKATWEDYMAEIPQELIELGQEFARRIKITYFRIKAEDFNHYIKQSPIMTFVRPCFPENGIYYKCDKKINHAICLVDSEDFTIALDSYLKDRTKTGIEQYLRYYSNDYNFYDYGFIFNFEFMNEHFVKILKDENSPTVAFLIPAISEDALKTLALAFGREISKLDTQEDWDNIIDGKFTLNK